MMDSLLYKHKYQILLVSLCLSIAVFGVFMCINLFKGRLVASLLELVILIISSLSVWKLKSILKSSYSYIFTVAYTCVVTAMWLVIASLNITSASTFMWIFAIPIVSYAVNGVRHGFILTVFILCTTLSIYFLRFPLEHYNYELIEWFNVGLCFTTIWVAVHFYEKGNSVSKDGLIEMVTHDKLTGLQTRDQLYRVYKEYPHTEHSLILIDINELDKINHTHGYLMGDVVLISLANIIVENTPDSAEAFRIGDDEFVVLLPDTHEENAQKVSKEVLLAISEYKTVFKQKVIQPKVSMGTSSIVSDGRNLDALMAKIDIL